MNRLIDNKNLVDIEYCFIKCKASFQACIETKGNEFFHKEIEVPIKELILEDDSVNVIMDSDVYGESILDVRIKLFSKELNKHVGYFRYIENFNGEGLDDYLNFD